MLDRIVLLALTPLALAGGTATSWLQARSDHPGSNKAAAGLASPAGSGLAIARGADGMLHTLVTINGVPVDMVVDTGASRTILSEADARRVFGSLSADRASRIRTLGGDRDLMLQATSTVQIGQHRFGPLDAGTIDGAGVSVIGLDWLSLVGPITIAAAR